MKKRCKNCEHNCEGDYCFRCKPRKPLPKIARKLIREIPKEKDNPMHEFFISIWNKRPHKSEISGEWLGNEALSIFFHHILEKNKYPEAMYDEENIILVTWEEHNNVGMDMHKYEEINKRREKLKKKYNIT